MERMESLGMDIVTVWLSGGTIRFLGKRDTCFGPLTCFGVV